MTCLLSFYILHQVLAWALLGPSLSPSICLALLHLFSRFCSDSSHTFPPVQMSVLLQLIIGFSVCDSKVRQHCFILFSWFCFGSLSSLCLFVKRFDVCSSSGPAFDSLCLIAGGPVPHMLTLSWWCTHLDMIFECCVYRKACLLNTEWSLVKFRLRVKRQSPSTPFQQKISWIIHICSCAGEKNWWRTAGQSRMCVCVWRGYLGWQCCSTFSTSREKLSYHEPLLFTRS